MPKNIAHPSPPQWRGRFTMFQYVLAMGLGLCCADASLAHGAESDATHFVYFRSDHGLATGTGALPDKLDAPDLLNWKVQLDSGHSTPILVGKRIFLTSYRAE